MDWKDTLLPGSSRTALPGGAPNPGGNYVLDTYGPPQWRNDWVLGPGGRPVISGSSEQQGGPMSPSPGFEPVDAGVYSGQVFAGRGVSSLLPGGGGSWSDPAGSFGSLVAQRAGELLPFPSLLPSAGGLGWSWVSSLSPAQQLAALRRVLLLPE